MSNKMSEFLSYIKNKLIKEKEFTPRSFEIYPYNRDRILNPSTKAFLHEYNKYTTSILDYDGVRDKQYYIADSSIFKDYIDEVLKNPDTSFKSYIHDTIKSGYYPQNINCIRLTRSDQVHGLEVLGSSILNYFKIPTAYYCKVQSFDEYENKVLDHILSVDFISTNEDLHLYSETMLSETRHLEYILDSYKNEVYNFYKVNKKTEKEVKENIDKKIASDHKTLVKSFLVRACLLNDTDMRARNLGIIENKKENIIYPAPNFDLEFCLMRTIINDESQADTEYNTNILKCNLSYISDNYPHVLDEFLKETDNLLFPTDYTNDELKPIIAKAKANGEPTTTPIRNLYKNYSTINNTINEIKMEKEENENEIKN